MSDDDKLRSIFELIDANRDGMVSLIQIRESIKVVKKSHTKKAEEMLSVAGINDVDLSFEEFRGNMSSLLEALEITAQDMLQRLLRRGSFQKLFSVVDIDEGGSITKDELREMMNVLKPGMNDQDILNAMRMADTDGDGDIDFDEFCAFMENVQLDISLDEAAVTIHDAFEKSRLAFESRKTTFSPTKENTPKPTLGPRRKTFIKKQAPDLSSLVTSTGGTDVDDSLEILMQEEARLRLEIEYDSLREFSLIRDEKDLLLRINNERVRERRRRDFLSGGRETQREEIRALQLKRHQHEQERNVKKSTEQHFKLQDRMTSQHTAMVCYGQQFKLLRQFLNKGTEMVKMDTEKEVSDMTKTVQKRNDEMTGSLDKLEYMLKTVGRALLQESMLRNGDQHKDFMSGFTGDPDFSWLGGESQAQKSLSVVQGGGNRTHSLSMTHINFTDSCNLMAGKDSDNLADVVRQLKKYLFAIYRYYVSGDGLSFSDFQKLVGDCKLDVAGSLTVFWNSAIHRDHDCDVLGLSFNHLEDSDFTDIGMSDTPTRKDCIDFSGFTNMLLLLACEKYVAASSSSPQYKLQCFVFHDILPLLPHEVLAEVNRTKGSSGGHRFLSTQVPSVGMLLEEYFDVIYPVAKMLRKDVIRYLDNRYRVKHIPAQEQTMLATGICNAEDFLYSLGVLEFTRNSEECRLPKVNLSASCRGSVSQLQGDRGHPVFPAVEVVNYLAYRCPSLGRHHLRDSFDRAYSETLAATFPTLHLPKRDVETSTDPVPFPLFLAIVTRIACYTSIAAAVPPPPPTKKELLPTTHQVYSFLQFLTHEGHYVLSL